MTKIFGYVIGQDFYLAGSPSLSKEMLEKAIPVYKFVELDESKEEIEKKWIVALCNCGKDHIIEEGVTLPCKLCLKDGTKLWDEEAMIEFAQKMVDKVEKLCGSKFLHVVSEKSKLPPPIITIPLKIHFKDEPNVGEAMINIANECEVKANQEHWSTKALINFALTELSIFYKSKYSYHTTEQKEITEEEIDKYIAHCREREEASDYYFQLKKKEVELFVKFHRDIMSERNKTINHISK